jgi:hypothetical protein
MKHPIVLNWLMIASVLCFLTLAQSASAQTISELTQPTVNGQRSLNFKIDPEGLDQEDLKVLVFYSGNVNDLLNLERNDLSQGRAVLVGTSGVLDATFIFPHKQYRTPNRTLYTRYLMQGRRHLIRNSTVDAQLFRAFLSGTPPDSIQEDSPLDVNPDVHNKGECVYYRIHIKSNKKDRQFKSPIRMFRMPDSYNIGLAGDSYASGEGAPDEGDSPWTHKECHRSNQSGLVVGTKRFIHDYPDIAVEYRHAACSGAVMSDFTSLQEGISGDFGADGQLDGLERMFTRNGHEMNLLIMSIGGNDAGFGSYVINFYVAPQNAARTQGQAAIIAGDIGALAGRYDKLDGDIRDRFPSVDIAITTYPDPTNGPFGRCGTISSFFEVDYGCCLFDVDRVFNPIEEYSFSSNIFLRPLNMAIAAAATRNKWMLVDVEGKAGPHGICDCSEPYINTLAAALLIQNDAFGYFHPNALGYEEIYEESVAGAALSAFEFFVFKQTNAIFAATLSGEPDDDAIIPAQCPVILNGKPVPDDRLANLTLMRLPPQLRRFRPIANLIADRKAQYAIHKGNLEELRALPTYQALAASKEELKALVGTVPRRPTTTTKRVIPRNLSPSVVEARKRAQAFLNSPEFQAIKERVKATSKPPRAKRKIDAPKGSKQIRKGRASKKSLP